MTLPPDPDALLRLLGGEVGKLSLRERERASVGTVSGWPLERVNFAGPDQETVPALLVRPPEASDPVPAVLYLHAHGNRYERGCEELTEGRLALAGPWAPDLAAEGIAALCLEMPCFGARQWPGESVRAKAHLWHGRTLFGRMLAECVAALDWLAAQPFVDADRLGALGFSMGGTMAWWLAALEPRLRASVSMGAFADLGTLVADDAHDLHGIYMSVPGLLPVARTGEIAGLAAPRSLMIGVGLQDPGTPRAAFRRARSDVEKAYGAAGASSGLVFQVEPESGHSESAEMRSAARAFLRERLSSPA